MTVQQLQQLLDSQKQKQPEAIEPAPQPQSPGNGKFI